MDPDFSYDVFLCHSSKDKTIVRDIAERLKKDGLRVWFDAWELKSGDDISAKIEEGLARSRVLVLFLSANAIGPEWAELERHTLRFRDPEETERRFVAVRLDEVAVKRGMGQFVWIDWLGGKEQEYAKLLETCLYVGKQKATDLLNESWVNAEAQIVRNLVAEKIIQLDYKASINTYSFSPDDKHVLTGDDDYTVRVWDVEKGYCLKILKGHNGQIHSVKWSKDLRYVLSGSEDRTIRLWDLESKRCLHMYKHEHYVMDVLWRGDDHHILSCSWGLEDTCVIYLWNIKTEHCVRVFRGHTKGIRGLVLTANQLYFYSCSWDATIRLWEVETGICLRVFEGHTDDVTCVVLSTDEKCILSCSWDRTIRMWEVETGRCIRVLEGHSKSVLKVALNANGRHALSCSNNEVIVWDVETGLCLCVLNGHKSAVKTVEWCADGYHAFTGDSKGCIRVWDLSEFVNETHTSEATTPAQVQYTNAKVLLLGDTGVGKSGLAERLVNKQFIPTKSSHARKAHILESDVVEAAGGVSLHRETVLWDLAGQPAYRLVHQLSMEDAALACVLFDCRNETNPFEGAAYWSQVLDQAGTNTRVKKILVASRIDVGGLPAGKERIETFAREHGFSQFIATSASTGEGCEKLMEAIRGGIPWDEVPKVTTTDTLATLRDYVARLKGEKDGKATNEVWQAAQASLLNVGALHEGFCAYFGKKIPLEEFIAHLQRLEATDALDLLVFHTTGAEPRPEDMVLLDPTRVDAYASALLVAAKDEPDGPGHLLESRVRDGDFKLDPEERLADRDSERHVLWYVMENLLARDLALREQIRGEDYIVFPSQCTAELRFPGAAAFGVAFGFAGPIRSIYATLIAQLAHYEGFKKREFFQDAAAYYADKGGRCLIRLHDHGRGEGELEVMFDKETPADVRQGFLEFVGKHLEARSNPGSVTRRHAYHCASCSEPFEDRVVKARLTAGKKDLVCPICEEKTLLLDLFAAPTAAAEQVAERMAKDARAGRQRMTAALVIKAKEAEGKYDVFLSHNTKDKAEVEKIAKQLLKVGIRPWLDKWNLAPGDTISTALEKAIKTIPNAALFFGPADIGNWHIMEMRAYMERWASGDARMIPVILPGVKDTPELPIFIRQTLWVDMRDWEKGEDDGFYRLVCGILGKAPGDAPMRKFGVRNVAEWQEMNF